MSPILVTLSGRTTFVKDSQPLKAFSPMVAEQGVELFEMSMLFINLQSLKVRSPIYVMPLGIFISVNELHPLKASSPIDVTLLGKLMLFNELHPSNALYPTNCTVSGISIVVKEVQY